MISRTRLNLHSPVQFAVSLFVASLVTPLSVPSVSAAPQKKILFITKAGKNFDEVREGMQKELKSRYAFGEFQVAKDTAYEEFRKKVDEEKADLHVLMDNQAVSFLSRYNQESKQGVVLKKGVAVLGLNLKAVLKGNKEIAGVAFETPAYSLITQFRYVSKKTLKNVLVLYRKSLFEDVIREASAQLKREGIALEAVNVESIGAATDTIAQVVDTTLRSRVTESAQVDAVWVLLDSALLTPAAFSSTWVPIARGSKIPFVTGVENLVSAQMNFALFGITPNLADLASQAAQQVEAIAGEGVSPGDLGCEEPIGVNKFLNSKRAAEMGFEIRADRLGDVKVLN